MFYTTPTSFYKPRMTYVIVLIAALARLSAAQQSTASWTYNEGGLRPAVITVLPTEVSNRKSATFQHGTILTTCPCYEPSKPNCGIEPHTKTITAHGKCQEPTRNCAIPKCRIQQFTIYKDRCPKQIQNTTVQAQYCPECQNNPCRPRTVWLDGIGPVQR
jgi:hypothetical protein